VKRTLILKREPLAELTTIELGSVVGAAQRITVDGATCPVNRCVPTLQESCPTAAC
jgi:hypothetical protein